MDKRQPKSIEFKIMIGKIRHPRVLLHWSLSGSFHLVSAGTILDTRQPRSSTLDQLQEAAAVPGVKTRLVNLRWDVILSWSFVVS